MWFFLFEPQIQKGRQYRGKLKELEGQIEVIFRPVSAYQPPSPEEIAEWKRLAEEYRRRIPEDRQLTGLYAYISELAEKNNLENFNRRLIENSEREVDEGGIKRMSFDLELTFDGEYEAIVGFLAGLHSLERLVEVESLEITRKPPLVGIRMVLRSYYST